MRQLKNNQQNKSHSNSQIRIIGGSMRGRKINFTAVDGLRPTLDRIRETLFNWLVAEINGATCLDLYAGSGALGIEAISRGAQSVTLVDASSEVTKNLQKNLQNLSINNAQVINQTAECFLKKNTQPFDLVFLDPPFEKGMLTSILFHIKPHLSKNALIYVEQENTGSKISFTDEWEIIKSKKTSRFYYELISLV